MNAPARISSQSTGITPLTPGSRANPRLAIILCLGGASVGGIGLVDWLTSSDALITVIRGQPPMMPNTAIGLLLLGIAGALRQTDASRVQSWLALLAALLVLGIGLGTDVEYAFGVELGIDQLFIHTLTGSFPGRPSPPTAVALSCLSAAVLIFDFRLGKRGRPAEWLIVTAGLMAFTALLGQFFGAGPLYSTYAPTIGVAVHTAISIFVISLGLLLQRPDVGLMRLVSTSGPGNLLLRRLAPWAILAPIIIGLIGAHLLERPLTTDVPLVFAALTVLTVVVSLFLLAFTATRLNRAHDMLRQSEAAARRATQARDEMLGIVAHDLRNPLQLISTHSNILHRTGSDPVRESADGISDAVARMARMIKDLLDVTSLDAGQLSLKRERIEVSELIADSMEAHTPIASAANLLILSEAAEALPAVWADRARILQVFQNLIGNAMKFTSAGGHITLRAEAGKDDVVFSVSDTGAGVPPDALPHIFDRFWQVEKGSRRGAGLGLAIVKGIVDAHGGRIWARSTVGQGSTFYFTVPTAESAAFAAVTLHNMALAP